MDDVAIADVDAHVGGVDTVGGEEDQVALLQVGFGDGHAVVDLVLGGPVQGHAELLINVGREAGAVEGLRAGGAVDVGVAHVLQRGGHDGVALRVGGGVVVGVGLGDLVAVFHLGILGGDIACPAVAEDLVPAVGLTRDGEGVAVLHGAEDAVVGAGALADPQGVAVGGDAGVVLCLGRHGGDGGGALHAVGVLVDHLDLAAGLTGVHGHGAVGAGSDAAGCVGRRVAVHADGGAGADRRSKGRDGQGRGGQQAHGQQTRRKR